MMPRYAKVTDELLSAYLDGAVTTSERALVEAAVAEDSDIAWRLATLQHTVSLLGRLPDIPLPHSFGLTEAMVAEPVTGAAGVPIPAAISRTRPVHEPEKAGFWQTWQSFWQGGNVLMRNAAAASFAAFLVLAVVGGTFDSATMSQTSSLATQPEVLPQAAAEVQPADAAQAQSAESISTLLFEAGPNAELNARDYSTIEEGALARNIPSMRKATSTLVVQSAPAEPIPLPAESADEAQAAVALAPEPLASPVAASALVEQPAAEETGIAAEVLSAASAPIAAAAVTVADESAPEEEPALPRAAESSPADNEAAPAAAMEIAAPPADETVADETVATDADLATADDQRAEDIAQADAVATTSVETSATAMSEDADVATEMAGIDSNAVTAEETENNVADGATEATPRAEADAVEPAPMTTSSSTMSVAEADPLSYVQMIALSLTLLFASLWLLSRRTQSSPQ